jgi:hypothetical protein
MITFQESQTSHLERELLTGLTPLQPWLDNPLLQTTIAKSSKARDDSSTFLSLWKSHVLPKELRIKTYPFKQLLE